jgi:hypothetical protein
MVIIVGGTASVNAGPGIMTTPTLEEIFESFFDDWTVFGIHPDHPTQPVREVFNDKAEALEFALYLADLCGYAEVTHKGQIYGRIHSTDVATHPWNRNRWRSSR